MGDRGWIISAPKRSASVIPGGWWNIGGVILNAHCTLQTPPRRPARQKTEPHIERFFAPYSWRTQRSAHYATAQSRPRSGGRPRCPRYIPNCQACAVVEFADSMRDWRSLWMLGEACRSCKPTSTTSTSSTIELYRYTRFHVRRSTTGRHNGGGALLASSGRTVFDPVRRQNIIGKESLAHAGLIKHFV